MVSMMKFGIRLRQGTKVHAYVHIISQGRLWKAQTFHGWPKSFPIGCDA